jgi:hypothetical protein
MIYKLWKESQCAKIYTKRRWLMHGIKEIIMEAESLPVEERVLVIDSLLRTLNPPTAEIDAEWAKVARRRLTEIRSGQVKATPGNEVFAKIQERFEK